jgi:hypothetical protein
VPPFHTCPPPPPPTHPLTHAHAACCSIRQQLNEAAHVAVSKGAAASSVMLQFPDQQVMMAAPQAIITAFKTALDAVSK